MGQDEKRNATGIVGCKVVSRDVFSVPYRIGISPLFRGPDATLRVISSCVFVQSSESEKSRAEFVVVSGEDVLPKKAENLATVEEIGPSEQGKEEGQRILSLS